MKKVGYWNDGWGQFDYIWPQEIDGAGTDRRMVDYLRGGKAAIHWKGYSICRICGKVLGSSCLTDGVYKWPEKLEHYIVDHAIELPSEFVHHAESNNWHPPVLDDNDQPYASDRADSNDTGDWWVEWCAKHRDPVREPKPQTVERPFFTFGVPLARSAREFKKVDKKDLDALFIGIEFPLDDPVRELFVDDVRRLPEGMLCDQDDEAPHGRIWGAIVRPGHMLWKVRGDVHQAALTYNDAGDAVIIVDDATAASHTYNDKPLRCYCPALSMVPV